MTKETHDQNPPSNEELLDIGQRMSLELKDIYDDAKGAGCEIPSIKKLIDDWELLWARNKKKWQTDYAATANQEPTLLDRL